MNLEIHHAHIIQIKNHNSTNQLPIRSYCIVLVGFRNTKFSRVLWYKIFSDSVWKIFSRWAKVLSAARFSRVLWLQNQYKYILLLIWGAGFLIWWAGFSMVCWAYKYFFKKILIWYVGFSFYFYFWFIFLICVTKNINLKLKWPVYICRQMFK